MLPVRCAAPPSEPVVGRTCRPLYVATQGAVDCAVTVTVTVVEENDSALKVRPRQPVPPAPMEPVAALNSKPAGAVKTIVPLLTSWPAASSVICGPTIVVQSGAGASAAVLALIASPPVAAVTETAPRTMAT